MKTTIIATILILSSLLVAYSKITDLIETSHIGQCNTIKNYFGAINDGIYIDYGNKLISDDSIHQMHVWCNESLELSY